MGRADSNCIRREITTTPYYDRAINELMERRGICRSEAYRQLQLTYEGKHPLRVELTRLLGKLKTEAAALNSATGGQHSPRFNSIIQTVELIAAIL